VISTVEQSAQAPTAEAGNAATTKAYDVIRFTVSGVCGAVETPILLEPQFANPMSLTKAGEDEEVVAAGVHKALPLRRYLLGIAAIPEGLKILREAMKLSNLQSDSHFRIGTMKNRAVLVEACPYQAAKDGNPPPNVAKQMEKITAQLSEPKRPSFHILPCVGYIEDKLMKQFRMIFEIPEECDKTSQPTMLLDLYTSHTRVPLGHRIQLAHALIGAVENFHRVGWVHKGNRSNNVCFLSDLRLSDLEPILVGDKSIASDSVAVGANDLASPWLCGFEYSRANLDETAWDEDHYLQNNIYRHPH